MSQTEVNSLKLGQIREVHSGIKTLRMGWPKESLMLFKLIALSLSSLLVELNCDEAALHIGEDDTRQLVAAGHSWPAKMMVTGHTGLLSQHLREHLCEQCIWINFLDPQPSSLWLKENKIDPSTFILVSSFLICKMMRLN